MKKQAVKEQVQEQEIIPVFYTIQELPLTSFIKCCVENDYSVLIKQGNPPNELIEANWMELLSKYYEVRGDSASTHYIGLQKDIWLLKLRIELINSLIRYLKTSYDAKGVKLLQDEGYEDLAFSPESLDEDIRIVIESEGRTMHDLQMLELELQGLNAERGERVSEEDFYTMVVHISKQQGVGYKVSTLSTYEYAIHCKLYDQQIREQIPQYAGRTTD